MFNRRRLHTPGSPELDVVAIFNRYIIVPNRHLLIDANHSWQIRLMIIANLGTKWPCATLVHVMCSDESDEIQIGEFACIQIS